MKTLKWVVVALVIAALAYGAWWYIGKRSAENTGFLVTSPEDTSSAALDQDLATIEDQLSGLDVDSASIDAGLNDQSLPLE
jgi:hypothetical protein